MGLGIWVHVGWFQLPRKKGEGSERERRAWAGGGGATGPSIPSSFPGAMLASWQHEGPEGRPLFSSESKPPGAGAQKGHPPRSIVGGPPPGLFTGDFSQGFLRAAHVKELCPTRASCSKPQTCS